MHRRPILATLFCIAVFSLTLFTQSGFAQYQENQTELDLDEILQAFGTEKTPTVSNIPDTPEPRPEHEKIDDFPNTTLSGGFSHLISYAPFQHTTAAGYPVHGLISCKPRLNLALETKFSTSLFAKISGWAFYDFAYTMQGYNHYPPVMIENYENEIELGETYIRKRLSTHFDISAGRQVAVWGKSDFFRVVDLFNPIDNRERGLDDIEFKRLPLWMTQLDSYFAPWQMSTIVTHELRNNKEPVFGSDFYPYNFQAPPYESKSNTLHNSSWGISAERSYQGIDVGLYYGSFLKEFELIGLTTEMKERKYSRLTMVGGATEKTVHNWLFKIEAALINGLQYYSLPGQTKTRLDTLFGTDYTGFANTRLSLEIVNRHLFQLDSDVTDKYDTPHKDALIWATRIAKSFQNDNFEFILISYAGGITFSQGAAQNVSLKYKISDMLAISAGYIFIQSGDNYLMENVGKNDRAFCKFNYTF